MPQEFQVLRCYKCETFQVHQVKKALKWNCKLCGEKQSIKKVYGLGSGVDCRKHVQQLNTRRGELSSLKGALSTADNYLDNSYHDNSYHDYSEDLPDDERCTRPGTSKWSQFNEVSEEPSTNLSDGEDDPQVTTDRNYFKKQNKAMKRKAKQSKNLPSKYHKWEDISCVDQADSCHSGMLMFGSTVKKETGNYSQNPRTSQSPDSSKTEIIGGFNNNEQFKVQENRKQSGNNVIPSHKTLDEYDIDSSSKWGRYVQNNMKSIHNEENEEGAGIYVPEEGYIYRNRTKIPCTDYDSNMNDETVHTMYRVHSSSSRGYVRNETCSSNQEMNDTTELDKVCSQETIITDSKANHYGSNFLQEHGQPHFNTGVDRSRSSEKFVLTESQKPKGCDSVNAYQCTNNDSQKENQEHFRTETSKNVSNSGSKWSKFMVEGHSQSVADDNDNNDDNFVSEDIKAIMGYAHDSEVFVGHTDESEDFIGQTYDSRAIVGQVDFYGDAIMRHVALPCKDITHEEMNKNRIYIGDKMQVADKTVSDGKSSIAVSKDRLLKQLNVGACSDSVHVDETYKKEKLSMFSAGELADEDLEF